MADGSGPIATEEQGYSVSRLRRQYLDFIGAKRAEIEEQRSARHYYHGDQLTPEQMKTLKARRQPPTVHNRIGRKIDGVVGLVERLKQDPKAYPRTPQHEDGADLGTATLRYVLDRSDWKSHAPEAARIAGINGIGGIEVFLEAGDKGDPELGMAIVDPDTYFYDPRSMRDDFSDARFMGVAKWVDQELAKEMFPDKTEEIDAVMSGTGNLESWQQQDREKRWIDIDEKRLFIVEHWYLKGVIWRWCFYVGTTELASGESPFVDEDGKTFCRFLMFSAYIDHDGDRYGFVRNMKPLQDEINARYSKAMHLLNTRRIIMEQGAVDDVEKLRTEAARPDGVIVRAPSMALEFDDVATANDMQGQLVFLQENKTEIENFGPSAAVLGQGLDKSSGRAIALLQQAGVAELGPFILAYRNWKVRVYRACWNIVKKHWTNERFIRVTDAEGAAQLIPVNGIEIDPMSGQPRMVNSLGDLDVDIILDEGPDNMNMMQDAFDVLVSMGPQVPWQVIVEMSQLPADVKKRVMAAGQQQQDPLAQQKQMLEMEGAQATVGKTKAEALDKFASASEKFARVGQMPDEIANQRDMQQQKLQQRAPAFQ